MNEEQTGQRTEHTSEISEERGFERPQRTEHTSEISEGFGSKRYQEKVRKELAFLQEFIKLPCGQKGGACSEY
jgi:hypothetical protein